MSVWSHRRRRGNCRGRTVRGYTIRGPYGRIKYVGVTNNPARRALEHGQEGKRGTLRVETVRMTRAAATLWEGRRLSTYRRNHSGHNPSYNRTRSGGWRF